MFKFRTFSVEHDACAMKVNTDGVLLGAWADRLHHKRVLDIGTGCGVIALIAAHYGAEHIDAVEIDEKSAQQAQLNFSKSRWQTKLNIHFDSFQSYIFATTQRYSHIISNPPYFSNSLQCTSSSKTVARHNSSLQPSELAVGVSKLLENDGLFSVILPPKEGEELTKACREERLFPCRICEVCGKRGGKIIRNLITYSRKEDGQIRQEKLTIREADGSFSEAYKKLTKELYL